MARTKRCVKRLKTIWQCPDDLWDKVIAPALEALDPPAKTGRKRIDPRPALDGIIYQLRSGCQWNALPRRFGNDRSIHRTFQRWIERGVFAEIWSVMIGCCADLDDVQWSWQSADGFMGKARHGGIKSARIPRIVGKKGRNARFSSMALATH